LEVTDTVVSVGFEAVKELWVIWQEVGAEIAAKLSVRFPSSKQAIEFRIA